MDACSTAEYLAPVMPGLAALGFVAIICFIVIGFIWAINRLTL